MNKLSQVATSTKTFLGEVNSELRKCSWPTRPELFESTIVVIVSVVIVAAAVGLCDLVLMQIMNLVIW